MPQMPPRKGNRKIKRSKSSPTNVGGKKYPKAVSRTTRNKAMGQYMQPLVKKHANKVSKQARKQK